jgi:hypothetical protein
VPKSFQAALGPPTKLEAIVELLRFAGQQPLSRTALTEPHPAATTRPLFEARRRS